MDALLERLVHIAIEEAIQSTARSLGSIHGHIGLAQDGLDRATVALRKLVQPFVLWIVDGDADAHAYFQRKRRQGYWLWQCVDDAPSQSFRFVVIPLIGQENAKLVAAQSRHDPLSIDKLGQTIGDHPENLVPKPMAIEVVDRFELIEIDDEERAATSIREIPNATANLLEESPSVCEAGQNVIARKAVGFLFGNAPPADFAAQIGESSPGIDDGGEAHGEEKGDQLIDLPIFMQAGPVIDEIEGIDGEED